MNSLLQKPNLLYLIACRRQNRIPNKELKYITFDENVGVYRYKLYYSMLICCQKLRDRVYYYKIKRLLTVTSENRSYDIKYFEFEHKDHYTYISRRAPVTTLNGLVDGIVTYVYNPAGWGLLALIAEIELHRISVVFSLGVLTEPVTDQADDLHI